MRADAAWRLSEERPWDFYKVRPKRPLYSLLSSPFFSDRAFVAMDLMHVADCKGVTSLVIGSIVSVFLADDRLGTSKRSLLQLINSACCLL